MKRVEASPSDPSTVPWQGGCVICAGLSDYAEPGLFAWVRAVGGHMERAHSIALVAP